MKIYLVRHGQTNLNKDKRMQGLTDEPLNEVGILQAHETAALVENVDFDAVYASPLDRAITTGAIVGRVAKEQVIIDKRLIETVVKAISVTEASSLPRLNHISNIQQQSFHQGHHT